MDAKKGMSIYLVCGFEGGTLSVFSTLENALKKCKEYAKKQVKMDIRTDKQIKWKGTKYVIVQEKDRLPGFYIYRVEKDGKKYGGNGFYAWEFFLDKPHINWFRWV